jgi:hypothetical protein
MFGILKYKSSNYKIFISAVVVFIILNIIENYIHYNIGRHHDSQLEFKNPSFSDWMKIIITMIIFAILQGFFTLVLDKYLEK